jgi:tetratricopeptide (TPR) repeat protein
MKSALVLLALTSCLWPATDPRAAAEAEAGFKLAREGKYTLAISHYRAASELDPALPGINLNIGLAYFKLNRFADAVPWFEKAVQSDPAGFQARVLLGMDYYGCRRFADAAMQLKVASEQQPENTELRYKLAQSYLWSQQYEAAKQEFRFLLTKNPDSAPVHMLLGEVLDAANQVEAATAEFEIAAQTSPREPEVHFGLGYLYWKQKLYEEARREFLTELAAQPRHTQALTYLADTELHSGSRTEAETRLRRVLKLDPNVRLAHLDLGILLADREEFDEAAAHFHEAIRIAPTNPDAHYRLGRLWLATGRQKDADAEFAKVKALAKPEQPPPLITVRNPAGDQPQ